MMRELDRLGAGPEVMAAFAAPMETVEDLHRFFEATGPYYFPHSQAPTWATAFERLIFSADGGRGGDQALEGWDVSERLPEIGAPALVVTGADDFLFPPERAQALHEGIADSTLAVVERSGHLPFIEQRHSFLELVSTFTRRS